MSATASWRTRRRVAWPCPARHGLSRRKLCEPAHLPLIRTRRCGSRERCYTDQLDPRELAGRENRGEPWSCLPVSWLVPESLRGFARPLWQPVWVCMPWQRCALPVGAAAASWWSSPAGDLLAFTPSEGRDGRRWCWLTFRRWLICPSCPGNCTFESAVPRRWPLGLVATGPRAGRSGCPIAGGTGSRLLALRGSRSRLA